MIMEKAENLFGAALGGLFDQVNRTIQQATEEIKSAGLELEIEAGEEISRAIEQVKNNYRSELDTTIDKISRAAKTAFDNLSSMVEKFTIAAQDEMEALTVQAQQLANSFPFSSKLPQLSSVQPRYVVIDDIATASFIVFRGNFPYSAKVGWEPSLTFSDEKCILVHSETQSFTFQIPHHIFNQAKITDYSYRTGLLRVPFDDGRIFSHRTEFDYRIGLGALPQLAGTGSVEYASTETKRVSHHITTEPYKYNGNSWYPTHWHEEDLHVYPTPGWTIDTSKPPQIVDFHRSHGKDSAATILSVSPTAIVVHVKLYCADGHNMDIFEFKVGFDQYQDQSEAKKRTESFEMNWRDSKVLEPQGDEVISKVVFNDYKGVHQEYAQPTLRHGVLQIEGSGDGKWTIWAEPPREITLKATDLTKEVKEKVETVNDLQHLLRATHIFRELELIPPKPSTVELKSIYTSAQTSSSTSTQPIDSSLQYFRTRLLAMQQSSMSPHRDEVQAIITWADQHQRVEIAQQARELLSRCASSSTSST